MAILHRIAVRAERLVYRIAAMPIALRGVRQSRAPSTAEVLRHAFVRQYWRPTDVLDGFELALALILWPAVVPLAILWFTARNGRAVRRRSGKSEFRQALEQLRLYFSAGILAPWYYIFSLHDDGPQRAPTFLQRSETKWGIYLPLRVRKASPLSNKRRFAERCEDHGIRCAQSLLYLDGTSRSNGVKLPQRDLFMKLANGRGGKGAERWDWLGGGDFRGPDGNTLPNSALIDLLESRARSAPILVQPRLEPHPLIADLTSGALPTVRALTCLNEVGHPELVAAVFRMSIGRNRTVDNIHAGGIACGVSLEDGTLGQASNLGADARLGWLDRHPDTGARISGRSLPLWQQVKELAAQAHLAFADRAMVGWDIAILDDGPIVIEGNGSPDVDLMQRFMWIGFCEHRYGELLAHHLRARGHVN